MLLAYSTDPRFPKLLRAATPLDAVVVHTWRQIEKKIGRASCLIPHMEPLEQDEVDRFCLLRSRFALLPVVAVAKEDPDVAIAFRDVVIEELVWSDNIKRDLNPAIHRAVTKSWFNRVATAVRANDQLTAIAKDFLISALMSAKPFTKVAELAGTMGVDTKTIHNHWRQSQIGSKGLSPKTFLDWILLTRATSMRKSGQSWRDVIRYLGVHQRTLDRMAKRLTGKPLNPRLAVDDDPNLVFNNAVVPLLFGDDVPEVLRFSANCQYT